MTLDELADAALAFANHLRLIAGDEPVDALKPGTLQDCGGCPVVETAGPPTPHPTFGFVNGWHIGPVALLCGPRGGDRKIINTPPMVRAFMAAFDAGEFPELVREPEAVAA